MTLRDHTGGGHTPGPWEWSWAKDGDLADGRIFTGWNAMFIGAPLCVAVSPRYQKQAQWEADAALIAAAPDLLKACQRAYSFILCNGYDAQDQALLDKRACSLRQVARHGPKQKRRLGRSTRCSEPAW
jgi:hypothetical protein